MRAAGAGRAALLASCVCACVLAELLLARACLSAVSVLRGALHAPQRDPPVLLLDEPTSGLDSRSTMDVMALLHKVVCARRQVVVLSIH